MKIVFLTFCLLSGLFLSGANAQSCDKVCPPGCCLVKCNTAANGSAAALSTTADGKRISCSPEEIQKCCEGKKLSKKEVKACQAACEASKSSASAGLQHVAPVHQSAPTCQPACCISGKGKTSRSVSVTETAHPAPKATKG